MTPYEAGHDLVAQIVCHFCLVEDYEASRCAEGGNRYEANEIRHAFAAPFRRTSTPNTACDGIKPARCAHGTKAETSAARARLGREGAAGALQLHLLG